MFELIDFLITDIVYVCVVCVTAIKDCYQRYQTGTGTTWQSSCTRNIQASCQFAFKAGLKSHLRMCEFFVYVSLTEAEVKIAQLQIIIFSSGLESVTHSVKQPRDQIPASLY